LGKSNKQERQSARKRAEREARIRAAKRRKRNQILAVVGVLVLLLIGGLLATRDGGGGSSLASGGPGCDGVGTGSTEYTEAPEMTIDTSKSYHATMTTNQGVVEIDLYADKAPKTVNNFVTLACDGFYDGLTFHRIIPDFMIQGGDPQGTGAGGPGYQFEDEFDPTLNFDKVGLLAMANSGPNTNGSQFFITVAETPWLNQKHTIFGEVTSGYEIVETISKMGKDANDRPNTPVTIDKIEITTN
jgi:cyclophilin family peptidyl-prolyl cis-trans isomerase